MALRIISAWPSARPGPVRTRPVAATSRVRSGRVGWAIPLGRARRGDACAGELLGLLRGTAGAQPDTEVGLRAEPDPDRSRARGDRDRDALHASALGTRRGPR